MMKGGILIAGLVLVAVGLLLVSGGWANQMAPSADSVNVYSYDPYGPSAGDQTGTGIAEPFPPTTQLNLTGVSVKLKMVNVPSQTVRSLAVRVVVRCGGAFVGDTGARSVTLTTAYEWFTLAAPGSKLTGSCQATFYADVSYIAWQFDNSGDPLTQGKNGLVVWGRAPASPPQTPDPEQPPPTAGTGGLGEPTGDTVEGESSPSSPSAPSPWGYVALAIVILVIVFGAVIVVGGVVDLFG